MRYNKDSDTNICCICGKEFRGYGNNPYPICDNGMGCDKCNSEYILPARIERMKKLKRVKDAVDYKLQQTDRARQNITELEEIVREIPSGIEHDLFQNQLELNKKYLEQLQKLTAEAQKQQQQMR